MLRVAKDHAGDTAVQEMVSRAARTGGMRIEFVGGYLRVEADGDQYLAFTALFDGVFEVMKATRGLREARALLVEAAVPVMIADPAGFLSSRLVELLPLPLRVRLELGARGRLEGEGGSPGELRNEETVPGDATGPGVPAAAGHSFKGAQAPSDSTSSFAEGPSGDPVSSSADEFLVACAQVPEIPARRAKRLSDSGYRTLEEVAAASPEEIAERTGWSAEASSEVRKGARSHSAPEFPPAPRR